MNVLLKGFYFSLFVVINIFSACNIGGCDPEKSNVSKMDVNEVANIVLGQDLEALQKKICSLHFKDTTLSYEDIEWKGIVFSNETEVLFLAETSWLNPQQIHRVAILSKAMSTNSGIHIGSNFRELKDQVILQSYNELPDGYLGFVDKGDQRITYLMDITNHKYLYYFRGDFTILPDSLTVESIVIVNSE